MFGFELLKRTYPISKYKRYCDGYFFIINNTTVDERKEWGVTDLQLYINEGEKYIYQVAKDGNEFKTMYLSFKNHAIIRKFLINSNDET
ncbi:MAG: hypothetical protein ACOC2W_00960 [bacterium]